MEGVRVCAAASSFVDMIITIDGLFRSPSAICLHQAPRSSSVRFDTASQQKPCLPRRVQTFSGKLFPASNDRNTTSSRFRARRSSGSGIVGSEDYWFSDDLGLEEERGKLSSLETDKLELGPELRKGTNYSFGLQTDSFPNGEMASSGPEFVQLNRQLDDKKTNGESGKSLGDEDVIQTQDGTGIGGGTLNSKEEQEKVNGELGFRRGRQVMRRSNVFAKQVISIRSALSLGFVSELWVDTESWVVMFLEVRPNLLSGESEMFLLEDVTQVGDVVLVQDESVIENKFKMVGLETLVGYKVVTPSRRNIGKVRGFTFNINSGDIDTIELDSFGIAILPSSLVSTYALLVEDVLEVVSEVVVVHEAAASRIQRLSKGLLGNQDVGISDKLEEYLDMERQPRSDRRRMTRRSFGGRNLKSREFDTEDDWELPKDYL